MRSISWLAVVPIVAACAGVAHASGPISVYALVDKVTFEPGADHPERIRISGVFITSQSQTGGAYSAPRRGYLYFSLPRGNWEDLARREWADLKAVAGTRQVIGVGSSWFSTVRVRQPKEEAKNADEYPLGNGLIRVNPEQPRAKALLDYKDR
jgi:hypothetical protein